MNPLVLDVHAHSYTPLSKYINRYTCMNTHTRTLVLHVHVHYTHPLLHIHVHVHAHVYSPNSFMYSTCMYIIILTHWIYLYITCTKAEKIVLTFKSFTPLENININQFW